MNTMPRPWEHPPRPLFQGPHHTLCSIDEETAYRQGKQFIHTTQLDHSTDERTFVCQVPVLCSSLQHSSSAHWLPGAIADSSSATGPSSNVDKFESNTSNPVSDAGPQTLRCAFFFFSQELRLPQLFGQRLRVFHISHFSGYPGITLAPPAPLPCPSVATTLYIILS